MELFQTLMSYLSYSCMWRLNAPHVQSVSGETRSGCLMAMTAAVRSPPVAPAQRTARTRWCPPSLPVCPSSRTMAKSTPTLMARLEWVSTWKYVWDLCEWWKLICQHVVIWWFEHIICLVFHSHLWDVWDGRSSRCFLLQNQALLQCVLFQELFLKFQKS